MDNFGRCTEQISDHCEEWDRRIVEYFTNKHKALDTAEAEAIEQNQKAHRPISKWLATAESSHIPLFVSLRRFCQAQGKVRIITPGKGRQNASRIRLFSEYMMRPIQIYIQCTGESVSTFIQYFVQLPDFRLSIPHAIHLPFPDGISFPLWMFAGFYHIPRYSLREPFDIVNSFDVTGAFGREKPQLTQVSVNPRDGNLFFIGRTHHEIYIANPHTLHFVAKIGGFGTDTCYFNTPVDISFARDGSFFVVVDYGNRRIQVFDAKCHFLWTIGYEREGEQKLSRPYSVGIDLDNNIYIADEVKCDVFKYSQTGRFILSFSQATDWRDINTPTYMAVSDANEILLVMEETPSIHVYNTRGMLMRMIPMQTETIVVFLCRAPNKGFAVGSAGDESVHVYGHDDSLSQHIPVEDLSSAAFGLDGRLYLLTHRSNKIIMME